VVLATDPDPDGEAVAWHLRQALGPYLGDCRRITFAEISGEVRVWIAPHPSTLFPLSVRLWISLPAHIPVLIFFGGGFCAFRWPRLMHLFTEVRLARFPIGKLSQGASLASAYTAALRQTCPPLEIQIPITPQSHQKRKF